MYCFKCGNQLSDDAKFCANCGAKVSEDNLTRNIELKNTETSDKNETVQVTIDKTGNIANGNLSSNGGNTNDKVNPLFLGGNNVKNGGEKKERTTRDKIMIGFLVIFFLVGGVVTCNDKKAEVQQGVQVESNEAKAISYAKSIISQDLKDPSSVIWNSTNIEDRDNEERYLVKIDYSATNGFGGRIREVSYVALMLTDEGANYSSDFPYVPTRDYSALVIDASISLMKKSIGWVEEDNDSREKEQGEDKGILEEKEIMLMAENLVNEILEYSEKEYNLTYVYNTQIIYNVDNNYLVSVRFKCPQQFDFNGSCLVALRNENGKTENYVAEAFAYDYDFNSHIEQYKVIFEDGHELRDLHDVR